MHPALSILLAQATPPNTLDTPSWVLVVLVVGFLLSTLTTIVTLLVKRSASAQDRADEQSRETLAATINGVSTTLSAKLDGMSRELQLLRKRDEYYERMFEKLHQRDRAIEMQVVSRLSAIEAHLANHHSFKRPASLEADTGSEGHDD